MSLIRLKFNTIKSLCITLAIFLSVPEVFAANIGPLPFDHRKLLLVKVDKTEIPSKSVVSELLDQIRVRGRVQWVLASKPNQAVAPVVVPQDFSWDSPPSVQKMAERYKVDGIVWIQQRAQEILLKWYDGKGGQPLLFESVFLRADENEADSQALRIQKWVQDIWAKFPGVGFVAKRDTKFVYFEGALENKIQPNQIIEILRVESVRRHELFKTVHEFKYAMVGKAKIFSVDGLLAKGEIVEESNLDPVIMGDRYRIVSSKSVLAVPTSETLKIQGDLTPPQAAPGAEPKLLDGGLGELRIGLGYGSMSHAEVTANETLNLSKLGYKVDFGANFFITSDWLVLADFGYKGISFDSVPDVYSVSAVDTMLTTFSFLIGKRFYLDDVAQSLWVLPFFGYQNYSFISFDQNEDFGPSSKKWNALAVGFHLRFPLDDLWSLRLTMLKALFSGYSESQSLSGGNPMPGASEVTPFVWRRLAENSAVGAGFRYQNLSVRYSGAGDRPLEDSATSLKLSSADFLVGYENRF